LRQAGLREPILLMAGVLPEGFAMAIEEEITIGVVDLTTLEKLEETAARLTRRSNRRRAVRVHIKVDTGMHRLGIPWQEYLREIDRLREVRHLEVTGLFSHLANADNVQDDFAFEQLRRFEEVCNVTCQLRPDWRPVRHLANSDGIFRSKRLHFDWVRPGVALYGYCRRSDVPLKPVMCLKARIIQIKEVGEGDTVGYDRQWRAPRASRIAVLPLGYADGFSRAYGGGSVLLRQQAAPIVGRICMDMLMVDITSVPGARVGDEAVLLGRAGDQEMSAYELGRLSGTSHYQVLTSIQSRVHRIFHGAAS
jgi:alanine racemase